MPVFTLLVPHIAAALFTLQAAGLLLAEVFMVGAAAAGSEVLEVPALKRLLFDVFHEDIGLFKEYCLQVRGMI